MVAGYCQLSVRLCASTSLLLLHAEIRNSLCQASGCWLTTAVQFLARWYILFSGTISRLDLTSVPPSVQSVSEAFLLARRV
jgi:hypothetical protein